MVKKYISSLQQRDMEMKLRALLLTLWMLD